MKGMVYSMKNGITCTWFIEPKDAATNSILSECLPGENAKTDVLCEDGQKRNLWECQHSLVAMLCRSALAPYFHARFGIFRKEGKFGKVRPWKFEEVHKRRVRGLKSVVKADIA